MIIKNYYNLKEIKPKDKTDGKIFVYRDFDFISFNADRFEKIKELSYTEQPMLF